MGKHRKQSAVRSHTRTVKGKTQTVKAHGRKTSWTDGKKAAVTAGAGALVFTATAVELGFQVATVLLLIVGALIGIAFTVANGGSRGTQRGKAVTRRLLAPQSKKGRAKSKAANKGAFTCRRCGAKFSSPIAHVCRIRWSDANGKRKTTAGSRR